MGVYEEKLADLKQRQQQAVAQRARAEAAENNARAAEEQWRKRLLDDHGVSTPEEAKAKLAELESALDSALEAAQTELERTST